LIPVQARDLSLLRSVKTAFRDPESRLFNG